jgi:hypothetical protein
MIQCECSYNTIVTVLLRFPLNLENQATFYFLIQINSRITSLIISLYHLNII